MMQYPPMLDSVPREREQSWLARFPPLIYLNIIRYLDRDTQQVLQQVSIEAAFLMHSAVPFYQLVCECSED